MNTAILILAATNHHIGWNRKGCRHLVDIDGEPLLVRTLRQLAELGYNATVVTDKPEIRAVVLNCFVPEDYTWIVSTILSTRELWDDRTIVLMGDVVWDLYTLGLVLGIKRFPKFCGSGHEIHAITWLREHFERFEAVLRATEVYANARPSEACYPKHFYILFCNKDLHEDRNLGEWEKKPYWCIVDPILEVDKWEVYKKWRGGQGIAISQI